MVKRLAEMLLVATSSGLVDDGAGGLLKAFVEAVEPWYGEKLPLAPATGECWCC